MKYITAAQAAQRWGVTARRVQDLCKSNAIDGAVRWGRDWMIPDDAHRPGDRRKKAAEGGSSEKPQLPRKNPAIIFSNIYNTPGTADAVAESLSDRPEAAALFRAYVAYCRGDVNTTIALVRDLLSGKCGHDLQLGCGLILALCAVYTGSIPLWEDAKKIILTAPCNTDKDRYAVDFWIAAAECEIRETNSFPLWFTRGDFEVLPGDSYPSARFYYLRYLYLYCHEYAFGMRGEKDAQAKMAMFPHVAEPLIAQSYKEGAIVSEAFMRLLCAIAYHDMGNDAMATYHVDAAIALVLPDKLYMVLAEYRRQLDFLIDQRLALVDPEAVNALKAINQQFIAGWTVLHNTKRNRVVSSELTTRERAVAKQAAFGLSNKEIARRLDISVNTVKQSLRTAMDKTGAEKRSDLFRFL